MSLVNFYVNSELVDSLSTDYEDSFSLDSIQDLIDTLPISKKLIIARIQTVDVKQPNKQYYSYYNAYNLNKILFSTQIYLGKRFLHRMLVLNPLTNTDIIGNVCYFEVSSTPMVFTQLPVPKSPKESTETWLVSAHHVVRDDHSENSPEKNLKSPNSNRKLSFQFTSLIARSSIPAQSKLPSVPESEKDSNPSYSTSPQLKSPVTANTPSLSVSNSPQLKSPVIVVTTNTPSLTVSTSPQLKSPVIVAGPSTPTILSPRKGGTARLEIETRLPTTPIIAGDLVNSSLVVTPGTVTKFQIPLNQEQIQNLQDKQLSSLSKRKQSFFNSTNDSGIKFGDWLTEMENSSNSHKQTTTTSLENVQPEAVSFENNENIQDREISAINNVLINQDFGASEGQVSIPMRRISRVVSFRRQSQPLNKRSSNLAKQAPIPAPLQVKAQPIIYEAKFIGDEKDFLNRAEFRRWFKENALDPEDAKLFELPPVTREDNQEEQGITIISNDRESQNNNNHGQPGCCQCVIV